MSIITSDDIGRYIIQVHLYAEIDESFPKQILELFASVFKLTNSLWILRGTYVVLTRLGGIVAPSLHPGRSLTVGERFLSNRSPNEGALSQSSGVLNAIGPLCVRFTSVNRKTPASNT